MKIECISIYSNLSEAAFSYELYRLTIPRSEQSTEIHSNADQGGGLRLNAMHLQPARHRLGPAPQGVRHTPVRVPPHGRTKLDSTDPSPIQTYGHMDFRMTKQKSVSKTQLSESQGPLYLQIATLMRRRIRKGHWRPGERIPTLDVLAKELGVALVTLRQAVGLLEDEGFLWRKQGKGTFVSDDPGHSRWLHLKSDWSSLIQHLEGKEPRLLKVADGDRQPVLGDQEGRAAPAYHYMRRVHSVDGVPYAVIDIYLDRRCYVKAPKDFDSKMVIPVLESLPDVEINDVRQTFAFSTTDIETASLLEVPVNAPIGDVRRVLIDENRCAVYVGETLYRGDFVKLEVNLTR